MKNKQNKRLNILNAIKKVTAIEQKLVEISTILRIAEIKKPTRDIKPLGGPNYEKQTKQAIQIYTIFIKSKLFLINI